MIEIKLDQLCAQIFKPKAQRCWEQREENSFPARRRGGLLSCRASGAAWHSAGTAGEPRWAGVPAARYRGSPVTCSLPRQLLPPGAGAVSPRGARGCEPLSRAPEPVRAAARRELPGAETGSSTLGRAGRAWPGHGVTPVCRGHLPGLFRSPGRGAWLVPGTLVQQVPAKCSRCFSRCRKVWLMLLKQTAFFWLGRRVSVSTTVGFRLHTGRAAGPGYRGRGSWQEPCQLTLTLFNGDQLL